MKASLLRTLGVSILTVVVVIAQHLVHQPIAAEAMDGFVSGIWFSALFMAGDVLGVTLRRDRTHSGDRAHPMARGLVFSAVMWSLLWAAWSLPVALRVHPGAAFGINSASVLLAGLLSAAGAPRVPSRRAATG